MLTVFSKLLWVALGALIVGAITFWGWIAYDLAFATYDGANSDRIDILIVTTIIYFVAGAVLTLLAGPKGDAYWSDERKWCGRILNTLTIMYVIWLVAGLYGLYGPNISISLQT